MPVAPLQLPGTFQSPSVDLAGSLSQLGQVYQEAQAKRGLQDAFAGGQLNGDPQTLSALATKVLPLNPQLGLSLSQLATAAANRQSDDAWRKQEAARQASQFQQTFSLQKRSADRADDPTPDNFVADPNAPTGYRPIGPADPAYKASVAKAEALAKGDVPTIMGSGSSVVIPNKAAEGAIFTNKPPVAQMDDNTADFLATRVLAGDSRALIGLGRGAQGAENIAKIQGLVAQKAKEQGIDASGILNNIAAQSGLSSAYRTLGGTEVKFGTAEKAAQESFPIAQEASNAVPRTQWLAATRLIQAGQTQVNDPNLKKFLIATDTAVKDYARTINPTGILRESDIQYARKILSTADSPEAYTAALQQLNTEVGVMHRAIQRQKQQLKTGDDPGVQPRAGGHDLQLPAPPRIGELNQGYRFRGGDPADPNSWAKAQ